MKSPITGQEKVTFKLLYRGERIGRFDYIFRLSIALYKV